MLTVVWCPLAPNVELEELGPSERATEEASLQQLLMPMGLAIKEIRVSGNKGEW